jgi:ABC-type ATPase with predicted acetyltransferase domain
MLKGRAIAVGEDITVSPLVDPSGKIRIRTKEAAEVARWFGLVDSPSRKLKRPPAPMLREKIELALAPGTITQVTGASGAGKSSLLREQFARASERRFVDLNAIKLPADVPTVNCIESDDLMDVLRRLGRVGLGEAWSYLRLPSELSEGQRFRLRLAMALWRAARLQSTRTTVIACDEFAAVLDRVTAWVVARCLRRAIDASHMKIAAIVATSHDDLVDALDAEVIVACDFGRTRVETRERRRKGRRQDGP